MTSGVSSVSAIDTAVKVKSSTSSDDGSGATTQLAALQKQLSQLQNQLKKEWLDTLRLKYPVKVNDQALRAALSAK